MTTTDPPPLEPGTELVVARRTRLLRGLGWPLLVMGAGIAALAVLLVIVLLRNAGRDDLVGQLACQVQQLGGKPVGDVDCPPTPATRVTVRPTPSALPARSVPPIVIVLPDGSTRTIVASPAPRPSSRPAQRPPSRPPSPPASPRATPSASPVVVVCVRAVGCLPRSTIPRREGPR